MSKSATAAKVLNTPGVASIARALPGWDGLLVLNYHRIQGDGPGGPDGGVTGIDQEGLDAHLSFLTRHADLIAPGDVAAVLGRPGRHVLVTFDDGYRDNYELAWPVLSSNGVRAAFFLASGFIDRPSLSWWDELGWMAAASDRESLPAGEFLDQPVALGDQASAVRALTAVYKRLPGDRVEGYLDWCGQAAGTGRAGGDVASALWMTWDMAREMAEGGMTIGGHTDTHPVLARLSRDEQQREIARCATRLREELDQDMSLFSYPVGLPDSFNRDTRELLGEQGVEVAFSCYGGYQTASEYDRLDVRRATVAATADPARLNAMLVSPRFFARW